MENDCVIIKRKEYEELKALAESKKPDEIWITFTIRPTHEFESFPMVVVDQQKMSTKIEGKLIWQVRSIIENLSIKFDKKLSERENFWIDHRLPKMISQEREQARIKAINKTHDILKLMTKRELYKHVHNFKNRPVSHPDENPYPTSDLLLK
jgi:hypothetical protein